MAKRLSIRTHERSRPLDAQSNESKPNAGDAPAERRPRARRGSWRRVILWAALLGVILDGYYLMSFRMPGRSYEGPLPPATPEQKELAAALRRDVEKLAGEIGERNWWTPERYHQAADFIAAELRAAGAKVRRQEFMVDGLVCYNVEGEVAGASKPEEIVVVGAHYDSLSGTAGANDNGSGVAALLALARMQAGEPAVRTVRFVAFANEEPPFFQTDKMGSWAYAKECRRRGERVTAMLSLETIGYYTDEPKSQQYPFPLNLVYPDTGNFIGFVGNVASRALVRRAVATFRRRAQFPSEGGAVPGYVSGVGWSDHWAFWQEGYPAIMVTDTAPFRYPYYHTNEDTPDKLTYDRFARVVEGLRWVVKDLANGE